jgi:hypothetical protein
MNRAEKNATYRVLRAVNVTEVAAAKFVQSVGSDRVDEMSFDDIAYMVGLVLGVQS